jgi:hypothetical protein
MPPDRYGPVTYRQEWFLLLLTCERAAVRACFPHQECDDRPMNGLRQVAHGALFLGLVVLGPAGQTQSMTPSELRNMSASEFRQHIRDEGAQQFVRRLVKDIDPHSPEEPNYDIVLEHVAEGSSGWLQAAAEIAPYTEATFSQGLRVAIADALVVNPAGVLKMIGSEEHFNEACGYPFVRQTDTYMLRHKREALAALDRVHQPALAAKKEQCRKQLMDVPTVSASDNGPRSFEMRY